MVNQMEKNKTNMNIQKNVRNALKLAKNALRYANKIENQLPWR